MGGWAKGVETAKGSDRGEYLPVGVHDVEILWCDSFDKRSGGVLAKARVRVLATNESKLKILDEQDICYNVDPTNKDAIELQLADVRNFVAAANGVVEAEVDEPAIYYVFDKKNAAVDGTKIRVVVTDIKNVKKGTVFTKYKCSAFNEVEHKKLLGSRAA